MKKLLLVLIVLAVNDLFAQDDMKQSIQKLTVPSSPAASITDMQPTTILNPKSYNALETALYNNFTDGGSVVIPKDLGIEFTPYWAKERRLSMDDYLYPSFGQSFLRNASFSLASSQSYLLGDSTKSNVLGFGARTSVYFRNKADEDTIKNFRLSLSKNRTVIIKINQDLNDLVEFDNIRSTDTIMRNLSDSLAKVLISSKYIIYPEDAEKIVAEFWADTLLLPHTFTDSTKASYKSAVISILRKHLDEKDLTYLHFKGYLKNRKGFSVDLALATMVNFPTNNMEFSYAPKNAFWITPTYRFWATEKRVVKLMAVYRYQFYNTDYYRSYFPNSTIYKNNNDLGVSVSAELNKCSVQFELVGRASNTEVSAGTDADNHKLYYKKKSSDAQYVLIMNYRLTDQAILTFNLGNRFDPILNPKSTLISTLSVNFGFGSPKKSSIDLTKTRKTP